MEHSRIANAIGALSGALLIAATGWIGQHETTSPAPRSASTDRGIELQRPDETDPETSIADTLQSILGARPSSNTTPLYAYEADAVANLLVKPIVAEPTGRTRPCTAPRRNLSPEPGYPPRHACHRSR